MIEASIRSDKFNLVFFRAERCFGIRCCRAYLLSAIRLKHWDISYLLQLYRPDAHVPPHTDGPRWTKTLAIILWQPKHGRLIVHGPHRSFLKGRVILFNGSDSHEVTTCSSYRVSLLFQFARL